MEKVKKERKEKIKSEERQKGRKGEGWTMQ